MEYFEQKWSKKNSILGRGRGEVSIILLIVSVGKILQSCEQVMVIELSGVPQASNFISHEDDFKLLA